MTLSFSWATNANYSTGPDTGTPTKVDPASLPNGFIHGVIAAPQHVNYLFGQIATQLVKAVDGVGGGTYTLSSPLTFMGADVRIGADLEVLDGGDINVQDGGSIELFDGSDLAIDLGATANIRGVVNLLGDFGSGDFNVKNAAVINVESGAELKLLSGGTIDGAAGASIKVQDAEDLLIDGSSFVFRLALTPVSISETAGAPDYTLQVSSIPKWVMRVVDGAGTIMFALPVRPGDTITTLRLNLTGQVGVSGHAAPPATPPRFTLVSADLNGDTTLIAAANDPVTTVPAYNSVHSITLSGGLMPYLVTTDMLYVLVRCEGGAGSETNKTAILSVDGTGIARSFRGPNEFV